MQEVTGLSSVLGASILSGHPCLSWSLSSFQKFTWTCEGVNIVSWVKVLFLNCIEGGRVLQSKLYCFSSLDVVDGNCLLGPFVDCTDVLFCSPFL